MGEVPETRWPYQETHATHVDPSGTSWNTPYPFTPHPMPTNVHIYATAGWEGGLSKRSQDRTKHKVADHKVPPARLITNQTLSSVLYLV